MRWSNIISNYHCSESKGRYTLSIHVYFENKLFIEVIKTEESIIGLIVGVSIGLFVSYYVAGKIRKHHLINLEFLKNLYDRLSNVC